MNYTEHNERHNTTRTLFIRTSFLAFLIPKSFCATTVVPEPHTIVSRMSAQFIFIRFDSRPGFVYFLIGAIRGSLVVVAFVPGCLGAFRVQADKNDIGWGFNGEVSKKYRERILWGLDSVSEKKL